MYLKHWSNLAIYCYWVTTKLCFLFLVPTFSLNVIPYSKWLSWCKDSYFILYLIRWNSTILTCHLVLPFSFKITVSAISQAGCEEHHFDSVYSEDPGSQPRAEVAAQVFGHCSVRRTSQYVTFLFKKGGNSCQNSLTLPSSKMMTNMHGKNCFSPFN